MLQGSIASYLGLLSSGQQVLIRLAAVYAQPVKQSDGSFRWLAQQRSHCHLGSCNGAKLPATTKARLAADMPCLNWLFPTVLLFIRSSCQHLQDRLCRLC